MSQKRNLATGLLSAAVLLGATGASPAFAQMSFQHPASITISAFERPMNLYEAARTNNNLKNFTWALWHTGLINELEMGGPYTILAPTDDAFKKLPAGAWEELMKPENKDRLASIVRHHIVIGRYTSGDLANQEDNKLLRTLHGSPLTLSKLPSVKFNNNVSVMGNDIMARNGVIHVVDTVLMPNYIYTSAHNTYNPYWSNDYNMDPRAPLNPFASPLDSIRPMDPNWNKDDRNRRNNPGNNTNNTNNPYKPPEPNNVGKPVGSPLDPLNNPDPAKPSTNPSQPTNPSNNPGNNPTNPGTTPNPTPANPTTNP